MLGLEDVCVPRFGVCGAAAEKSQGACPEKRLVSKDSCGVGPSLVLSHWEVCLGLQEYQRVSYQGSRSGSPKSGRLGESRFPWNITPKHPCLS